MKRIVLIHYGELGLKGRNRGDFERKLIKNIAEKLKIPSHKFILYDKRIILPLVCQRIEEKRWVEELLTVSGIAWFALAWQVDPDLVEIEKITKKLALKILAKKTFAVRVKRANKNFSLSSIELEKKIGQQIVDQTGNHVNLKSPDITLFIEITDKAAYLFFEKVRGLGGLPTGTSGKILALLSGGIDSPVAAWLLAKRGAQTDLVHFSAFPPGKIKETKITRLYQILKNQLAKTQLYIIPYVYFQLEVLKLPDKFRRYEVLLFRRFMLKTAAALAKNTKAQALATGDNLGQVASQTLENLIVTDKEQEMSIFRPLIGFDKSEIINLAKKIGTYETSIEGYKDCCSLLHKQPVTAGKWETIEEAEGQLDMAGLIKNSLKDVLVIK
ncbi:tRNA 4-thiouridine(8) synthase ThiI [Candidatus Beckwithbacteria bacterium RBG_13_42_9]|uniref:Probable tRNA sulfurtransferase n=1 Tax=Candidatus Beckwithbacteria bacterium RBG_13_42_9 TaxID=1797457 RepID=A0A1F5E8W0_9BACT|nr:MAG: tRNA 4-thiouridine(8) synthase ThiI [Candidatus Beckwithbacteria bacterium RBG_13_42_9]